VQTERFSTFQAVGLFDQTTTLEFDIPYEASTCVWMDCWWILEKMLIFTTGFLEWRWSSNFFPDDLDLTDEYHFSCLSLFKILVIWYPMFMLSSRHMIKSLEFSGISFAICRNRVEMQAIDWLMYIAYDHLYPLKNSLFAQ
jgi:hypothetical protein